MAKYKVISTKIGKKNYYLVKNTEDMSFVYYPCKYLKYIITVGESPNYAKKIGYSIVYYINFLEEERLKLRDVYDMTYGEQTNHFVKFLNWLKYGSHADGKNKVIKNRTSNSYLQCVFGWLQYLHVEFPEYKEIITLEPVRSYYCKSLGVQLVSSSRTTFKGYFPIEYSYGKSISHEEIVKVLKACDNLRTKLQIMILVDTGIRAGELLGIHYGDDIDLEKRVIHIKFRENNINRARVKNRENRDVIISEATYNLLIEYIANYSEILRNSEFLFVSLYGKTIGKPLSYQGLNGKFEEIKKKTGIKVCAHMFRRHFAESRWEAGWNLFMIANAMGHKSIRTTEEYLNLEGESRMRAAKEYFETNGSVLDEI